MQTPHLEPPRILPESIDRRLYLMIHGLPHSPVGDRYVTLLSDLGEGLGWEGAGVAMAWLGGSRGRRAGRAPANTALGTTSHPQRIGKTGLNSNHAPVRANEPGVSLPPTDP